jgi:hypothetical protein
MKFRLFLLLGLAGIPFAEANQPKISGNEGAPVAPPLPPISAVVVEPAALTLDDARDARRVLVWGRTAAGEQVDLTDQATFSFDTNLLDRVDDYLLPRAKGQTEVTVSAAGHSAKLLV